MGPETAPESSCWRIFFCAAEVLHVYRAAQEYLFILDRFGGCHGKLEGVLSFTLSDAGFHA